jgi:ABC-type branched-subunit amino acid transport system ATPase component
MRDVSLHLKNVVKRYGGRTVVNIKDATFGNHGIEGLIGPNGAGKTTLISLITHKVSMTEGQIIYHNGKEDIDIGQKTFDQISRLGLVKTNQIIQDFENLSIRDSLLLSLAQDKHERFYNVFCEKALRKEAEAEIEKYLDYFHFGNPDGHALSAGEKKLLDIVRCMLLKPKFLLMDEPTAGLPQDQTDKVIELMERKMTDEGMSILIVEHDLDLIWKVSRNVFFMADGEILVEGTPDEVRNNEVVISKYMGEKNA